ncbi:hypothetical protein PINS_up021428 [Pythium insidiosum]|nr:hypothetical protein PINS_up021428 [Pythium insidiosum]
MCALIQTPLVLRVTGSELVENGKLLLRLSNASRYVDIPAMLERFHYVIVRVASFRHIRQFLPPFLLPPSNGSPSRTQQQQQQQLTTAQGSSQAQRDDDRPAAPSFTLSVKVECGDRTFSTHCRESAVYAAIASSTALGWEDQFEVPVYTNKGTKLLVSLELSDIVAPSAQSPSRTSSFEIARAIIPLDSLQEGVVVRRTFPVEENFRRSAAGIAPNRVVSLPSGSELDVFMHLSPSMMHADTAVCRVPPLLQPERLRVQISSGDSIFSACSELSDPKLPVRTLLDVYEMPVVTHTWPPVLPRTAGGELTIYGRGFVDAGSKITVRVFGCLKSAFLPSELRDVLLSINSTQSLQPANASFFVRDLTAMFVTASSLTLTIPPFLASYSLFFRVSMDGIEFTEASLASHVKLYSADAIEPRGGPVSGNTYAALQGTNIAQCMELGLAPLVRLTWMRGAKELESVVVSGEHYPHEDIVYFYTPQSKFGLQNITVNVDLCLQCRSGGDDARPTTSTQAVAATSARFGHDEVPFVVYRTPAIKAVTPLAGLVCGLTPLELLVQGLDERATVHLKSALKARFRRRGQMQLSDLVLQGEGKLVTVVPRFNVTSAVAIEVAAPSVATKSPSAVSPPSSPRYAASAISSRPSGQPSKLWTRQGAVFVMLLRARDLFVAKRSTCNSFVMVNCDKAQLKSSRKDGTTSPVWNELLDFDWRAEDHLPKLRLVVENQLTVDQSELIGQIEIEFADPSALSRPMCHRGWFPLRRLPGGRDRHLASSPTKDGSKAPKLLFPGRQRRHELGELELAIAYIPAPPKKTQSRFLQNAALKSTILSAVTQKRQRAQTNDEAAKTKRDRILRVFRRQGARASLLPNELSIEVALNGQDFWSAAPTSCFVVPTPVVVAAEPPFICIKGGTPLTIHGLNFVATGCIRVAFAVVPVATQHKSHASTWNQILAIDSKRVAIVDAKYRNSSTISCTTPPLDTLVTERSVVNLFVAINGVDFESIALPADSTVSAPSPTKKCNVTTSSDATENDHEKVTTPVTHDHYVLACDRGLRDDASGASGANGDVAPTSVLLHQLSIYSMPQVRRIRPADGIYTSRIVIEGREFTQTGLAVGELCTRQVYVALYRISSRFLPCLQRALRRSETTRTAGWRSCRSSIASAWSASCPTFRAARLCRSRSR